MIITALAGAIVNGAYEAAIIELYPTEIRYSGVALSHNMGLVIFGGLTPLLLAWGNTGWIFGSTGVDSGSGVAAITGGELVAAL